MNYSVMNVGDMPVSDFFSLMILIVLSVVFLVIGSANLFSLFIRFIVNKNDKG